MVHTLSLFGKGLFGLPQRGRSVSSGRGAKPGKAGGPGRPSSRRSSRRPPAPPVSVTKEEKERAIALIREEYRRLDALCGVDSGSCSVRISTRMVRRLGTFTLRREGASWGGMEIAVSARILGDAELFTDVIRHEYAHMLVYLRDGSVRHGHDRVWKAACLEVGCEPMATRKLLPR